MGSVVSSEDTYQRYIMITLDVCFKITLGYMHEIALNKSNLWVYRTISVLDVVDDFGYWKYTSFWELFWVVTSVLALDCVKATILRPTIKVLVKKYKVI